MSRRSPADGQGSTGPGERRDACANPSLVAAPHTMTVDSPLVMASGRILPRHEVRFETYGTLSPGRDNAILVCHSLTKGAHAAGRLAPSDNRPGWWDSAIGPDKMLDTDRYFVICADALAAGGSTGPASVNPATGRRYGLDFPIVTVADMVHAQHGLLSHLGIERMHAVIGGCLGGQQALQWAISHPGAVRNAIVITTTPATSAHTIAIFAAMRHLIRSDPDWKAGNYYETTFPLRGLRAAIVAAVPLWMSHAAMQERFGRTLAPGRVRGYSLDPEFEVEAFMEQIADRAERAIDPNGFMYLMRAEEYFDLDGEYGSLERALSGITARVLFISYHQDWRFPAAETERLNRVLRAAGGDSRHVVLDSALGHGAFIYDVPGLRRAVGPFLAADPVPVRPAPAPAG